MSLNLLQHFSDKFKKTLWKISEEFIISMYIKFKNTHAKDPIYNNDMNRKVAKNWTISIADGVVVGTRCARVYSATNRKHTKHHVWYSINVANICRKSAVAFLTNDRRSIQCSGRKWLYLGTLICDTLKWHYYDHV